MADIYGAKSSTGWQLRLNYDISQSIVNNTSTLKLTLYIYDGTGLSYNLDSNSCYYVLQGTKTYQTYRYETKGWYTLGSKTITVSHADDGTGSANLSAAWYSGFTSSYTPSSLSVSQTITLPTIPRASTVSGTLTLGSAGTITVTRASDSFTHTVKLKCGTEQVTLCTKSTATTLSYTPPLSWAAYNVNGTTVDITAETTTYDGDTVMGTATNILKANIPASVKPTLTIALTDTTGYQETYGWVQSKSKLKVSYTAAGAQGSTIVSKTLLISGKTADPDGENAIDASGAVAIVATVTDTRGRTARASTTITVKAYSPPTISDLTFVRGTYSSNTWAESANGADLKVTLVSTVSVSTATITFYADYTEKASLLNQESGEKTAYLTNFGTDVTQQLKVKAEDAFGGSVTKEITVPTVAVILNLNFENMSACFGGVAERKKSVEFKLPVYFQDSLLDLLHPVGSIYTSTVSTDPGELFGGTWEQIKDVFLLAAGDTYDAGATGGEATHTLTVYEMPSHRHDWNGYSGLASVTDTATYKIPINGTSSWLGQSFASSAKGPQSAGGGTAHNNMPPYLVVYAWKRTE